MEIFSYQFKNWLKRNFLCRFLGHKPIWVIESWAIMHFTGYDVKVCQRCGLQLKKRKGKLEAKLKEEIINYIKTT